MLKLTAKKGLGATWNTDPRSWIFCSQATSVTSVLKPTALKSSKFYAKVNPKIWKNPSKMISKSVLDALWDAPGRQLEIRLERRSALSRLWLHFGIYFGAPNRYIFDFFGSRRLWKRVEKSMKIQLRHGADLLGSHPVSERFLEPKISPSLVEIWIRSGT